MVEISLRLNEWKFILEDGEPRSLLTPNLHVVGFMNCPPVHTDSDDYDLILDGLMPCLQRFPMLRAMAIIFYGYKGLSLGMSPYRPLPFHPLIQNNQYVLVIRRINHGWLELLDFPEVVPLPPKGKADCIGIHPITLLPTGMSLRNTSDNCSDWLLYVQVRFGTKKRTLSRRCSQFQAPKHHAHLFFY